MTKEVKVIKIVDPIVQSLLFVFFCYSLDEGKYQNAFIFMLSWELLSAVVHSFLFFSKKKVLERVVNFALMVLALAAFFVVKKYKESYVEVILGDGPVMFPVHEMIVMSFGVIVSFWYNFICFREIKSTLKGKSKKRRRRA